VAGLGAVTSLTATYFTYLADEARAQEALDRRIQVIASTIQLSLRGHEDALHSLRNLFDFSGAVSREEFAGMAADLIKRHDGIQALEWIERVPGERRAVFEAEIRAAGFPEFQFTEWVEQVMRRTPDRPEHFPVVYVHPYEPNRAVLGFDLASGYTWPDQQRAADENRMMSSGRILVITDGEKTTKWGYVLQLPVYQLPVPITPMQRRTQLRGFILGIFRLPYVIESSFEKITSQTEGLDLLIIDRGVPKERQSLYYRPGDSAAVAIPPSVTEISTDAFQRMVPLAVHGRTLDFYVRATPGWLEEQRINNHLLVLFSGLACTFLIGIYLRREFRRTELIEREVAHRTAELHETQKVLEDDIRRRESAENALKASEARLQAIVDHSPNSIFVKDLAGRYVLVNRENARIRGKRSEEMVGRSDDELFAPDFAAGFKASDRQALAAGETIKYELTIQVPDSASPRTFIVQKFPLRDEAGRVYGICGISTDITDRKVAEREKLDFERKLLAAQKLESLGVLAGGIAHDFNNILTSVLANASLARHDAADGRSVDRSLHQIELAARRAADLCQQMLAYAGKGKIVSDRLDLSELVRGTAALLEVTISKNNRLDLRLADGLPPVLADPTQLRQIVMNLVINAADAITGRPGLITVTTFTRTADDALLHSALGNPDLPAGTYVGLEVADNGSGMTPETIARIFEPFFTTKFSGRGLGLSAVLGIVQAHRGALFVESTPGQGSTFRLLLRASSGETVSSRPPFPDAGPVALRGTVLVVDDEEAVRSIAATVLEIHGAAILTAGGGDEALELLRTHGGKISLVLLDLTMPGLSGEETLRRMRMLGARQPVILMSGYSETETMQRSTDLGVAGFIQKPFEVTTLLAKAKPFLS